MLPEIVVKFLAEVLGCLTDHFVLLKTIDVVLDVLDGGENHVDGGVVLAIEEVGSAIFLMGLSRARNFSMRVKSFLESTRSSSQSHVVMTLLRALLSFLLIRLSLSIMSTSDHQRVTT